MVMDNESVRDLERMRVLCRFEPSRTIDDEEAEAAREFVRSEVGDRAWSEYREACDKADAEESAVRSVLCDYEDDDSPEADAIRDNCAADLEEIRFELGDAEDRAAAYYRLMGCTVVIHDAGGKFDETDELLLLDDRARASDFTRTRWYEEASLADLPFDVDLAELADLKGGHPYAWWHFEPRKTERDVDVFDSADQLAEAAQLDEIAW